MMKLPVLTLMVVLGASAASGDTVTVQGPRDLKSALSGLKAGSVLKIAPGDYPGGHHVNGIANLTVEALDPNRPPHFQGGTTGWKFSRCEGLTLRHLRVSGQKWSGLNLDDGGELDKPVKGITLENLEISDIGPQGNFDGIKCSGLEGLTIRDCTISGWAGQGIDFVGCHKSLITGCQFIGKPGYSASAGIQLKGGTSEVTVENCHFKNGGIRPVNVGGSTGLAYFRPQGAKHEARNIMMRNNVIEGSECAVAFVGVDGAEFCGNTILFPEKWIFRILQETSEPGFVPCRNVVIKDNRIVFRRSQVKVDLNISKGTEAGTFQFENNRWFAEDKPVASKPKLPVEEANGVYGVDPR
jgi:hypothetical protein